MVPVGVAPATPLLLPVCNSIFFPYFTYYCYWPRMKFQKYMISTFNQHTCSTFWQYPLIKQQLPYKLTAFWRVSLNRSLTFSIGGCSPSMTRYATGWMPGITKPNEIRTITIATMITIAMAKCQSFTSFERAKKYKFIKCSSSITSKNLGF